MIMELIFDLLSARLAIVPCSEAGIGRRNFNLIVLPGWMPYVLANHETEGTERLEGS